MDVMVDDIVAYPSVFLERLEKETDGSQSSLEHPKKNGYYIQKVLIQ